MHSRKFEEEINWLFRPMVPPLPINEVEECLDDLGATLYEGMGSVIWDKMVRAKSKYLNQAADWMKKGAEKYNASDNLTALKQKAAKGDEEAKKALAQYEKADDEPIPFKDDAEGKTEQFLGWMKDLVEHDHYKRAAKYLTKMVGLVQQAIKTGREDEALPVIQNWAKTKMLPQLIKRKDNMTEEARIAIMYAKKLSSILGL